MVAHQPGKAGLVEKYTLPALLGAITSMTTQSDVATLPQRTFLPTARHTTAREASEEVTLCNTTAREESEEHREDSEGKTLPSILGALTVLASEASLCRVMVPRLLAITESHWAGTPCQ
jgi:hypothetical protein